MFPIRRIDRKQEESIEPLGTKQNFWFYDEGDLTLFKTDERETGSDWAEVIACHLCELLGLPHVHYELAELFDRDNFVLRGVICKTCSPEPLSLELGNQLLLAIDPEYPFEEGRKYKVREHTVDTVSTVISGLSPPAEEWRRNVPTGIETALDHFVGYVMLDAWIANQDRHHQNWAALRDDELRLSPTFDHGSSFGFNISDEERTDRLETKDRYRTVAFFARRARSAFYKQDTDRKPLGTFEAFSAFAQFRQDAARRWLESLGKMGRETAQETVGKVPNERMSDIAKEFTVELLMENQKRLLEETEGT